MNVLVACEESQRVCTAFRKRGFNAYSCDIQEPSGGHPEWHILGDALDALKGGQVVTMDGVTHDVGKWDLLIAHPPCTHLAVSGAAWFEKKRADGRQREAIEFFCKFLTADCDKIAVENPVNIISGYYIKKWFPDIAEKYGLPIKPNQTIQPYMFGDKAKKTTCLWLKSLPILVPTNMVGPGQFYISPKGKKFSCGSCSDYARDENGKIMRWNDPRTGKLRSKTFPGIAKAMAEQWGDYLNKEKMAPCPTSI